MAVKNIVLVHGAWGDGSHWRYVVPLLTRKGYVVTAVQNPLSSFASDIKKTITAFGEHTGPILLVGHSYGGCVISAAGNDPRVAGLVFVAAYAPDKGESALELTGKYGGPLPDGFFVPDADGYVVINRMMFHGAFCHDVSESDAAGLNAGQKPTHPASLQGVLGDVPAWRNKPSWYAHSTEDRTVVPALQRFMINRMNARKTLDVAASHAPMLSKPQEIADLIDEAAKAL